MTARMSKGMEKKAVSAHICGEVLSQKFDHALSYEEASRRRRGAAAIKGLTAGRRRKLCSSKEEPPVLPGRSSEGKRAWDD